MKKTSICEIIVYCSLLFYFVIPIMTFGQSPGGYSGKVELWLKADYPVAGGSGSLKDNDPVKLWKDLSGNDRDHKVYVETSGPLYKKSGELMNFQPAVTFGLKNKDFLVGPNLDLATDKSYYIFYVSTLHSQANNGYVYTLNAGRNYSGWHSGNPYFATNTTSYGYKDSKGKKYGIVGIMRPNGLSVSQMMYFNSVPENIGRPIELNNNNGNSVVGALNLTGRTQFNGDIQEIIVLSGPKNTTLSDLELQKIHSYLSIKYGISLEPEKSKKNYPNYVNSNGDIIWDGTKFKPYQNYVFGIGRDDKSGLYQKQSTNYDMSTLTVFVGDELADLNDKNRGTLSDNTFLMLGTNDAVGMFRYDYHKGENFANGKLNQDIHFKLNKTLKAKVTGTSKITVNMKLNMDAKYILVSSVETFAPKKTRIYPIKDYLAKNIEIENDDYVSFISSSPNPGGVNLVTELWLRADDVPVKPNPADSDSTNVDVWKDVSAFKRDHSQNNSSPTPVLRTLQGLMNYHNHLEFSYANNYYYTALAAPSFIEDNKSYYIFYVSEVNITDKNLSVVYNPHSIIESNHGWYNNLPAFTNGKTTTNYTSTHSNPKDKTYGIIAVERTNDKNVAQRITFNGNTQVINNGYELDTKNTTLSLIGTRKPAVNNDPFSGNLQEIIVLSGPKGQPMDSRDLEKINSYLAIKYGISLDNTTPPIYYDSFGNKVWDGNAKSNSKFNNDIFGIARDDSSELYQKQSVNYGRSLMTVFVGDRIEKNNKDNTGSLDNNNYLMFGSNGEASYLLDYDYTHGSQFANDTLHFDINFRNKIVLKAQATGRKEFVVNIKPGITAKVILVSPDGNFNPSTTRIYHVVNKIAKDVKINDGDYIGFAAYDNAPGGVINGLRLWLRADDEKSVELIPGTKNVSVWRDQTSNQNDYYHSLAESKNNNTRILPPEYRDCEEKMNYFPSLFFNYYSNNLYTALAIDNGPMSTDVPEHATSFVVYNSVGVGSAVRTYTHGFGSVIVDNKNSRHPAAGFSPQNASGRVATTEGLYDGKVSGFSIGATALHMVRFSTRYNRSQITPDGDFEHDFGGKLEKITIPKSQFGHKDNEFSMASGGTIGGASIDNGLFNGYMSEVFFYERKLSEIEKERIRTYLAMKYAITLYKTINIGTSKQDVVSTDYILSDSKTIVWNGSDPQYSYYHNNVAGLVRDDNSKIFVNKARSTDVNAVVTMQAENITACGQGDNPALVNDFSGLFWGNNRENGIVQLNQNSQSICGGLDTRMERVWLVNKTNLDEQKVIITANNNPNPNPNSIDDFPYNQNFRVFLLVADSPQDIANENWAYAIPGQWINTNEGPKAQFKFKFKKKKTYFTFAAVKAEGVCTNCSFDGYKVLNPAELWRGAANNGVLSKTKDLGDNFIANINITDPGKVLRHNSPRRVGRALQLYRRSSRNKDTQPITTSIKFSGGAAAATFEISDIDTQAEVSDSVVVYGFCGGGKVKPKLMYVAPQRRSTYTINNNVAIGKPKAPRSSGYTAIRGRVLVDFPIAVEEIVIEYKAIYNNKNNNLRSQLIGIGPITLYCPKPVEVNEDGLALTLKVQDSSLTCEEVPFTFSIMNTNCEDKLVNLKDSLPSGMQWVENSLNVTDGEFTQSPNDYGNNEVLDVPGILVHGGSTTIVTARAKFTEDKTTSYQTRASINYLDRENRDKTYESCDLVYGCGNSTINSISAGLANPVTIDEIKVNKSCINDGDKILVTIHVTNPGDLLDNVTLNAAFTEGFEYIDRSFKTSFKLTNGTINKEVIPYSEFEIENFSLPPGKHEISFQVQAPTPISDQLNEFEVNIDMSTTSEIDCARIEVNGDNEVLVPFCRDLPYCTLDPNTEIPTEISEIGITTFEKTMDNWPHNTYNGFIVLESKSKGFVITRTTSNSIPAQDLVEGMIIYDTDDKCIKLYNGTDWNCIQRTCPTN